MGWEERLRRSLQYGFQIYLGFVKLSDVWGRRKERRRDAERRRERGNPSRGPCSGFSRLSSESFFWRGIKSKIWVRAMSRIKNESPVVLNLAPQALPLAPNAHLPFPLPRSTSPPLLTTSPCRYQIGSRSSRRQQQPSKLSKVPHRITKLNRLSPKLSPPRVTLLLSSSSSQ